MIGGTRPLIFCSFSLMTGIDNPDSGKLSLPDYANPLDIAGANAHGWSSLLVKTGVFREGAPAHVPTQVVSDVEEGVRWAIERELGKGK